jgi:serine/threonine protein phosphatase 1
VIRHDENIRGRDFFVSDLHGQLSLFQEALEGVAFDETRDRVFCVGDLVDRGEQSLECLSLVFEPWFFSVRGNHEQLALQGLHEGGAAWELWMINGGSWIRLHDAREVSRLLDKALEYLPLAREIGVAGKRIGMVHAEPPEDWALMDDTDPETLVWGRRRITTGDETPVAGVDAVVVGHTIVEQPMTLGNVHYIDTGGFASGRLTLLEARELLDT